MAKSKDAEPTPDPTLPHLLNFCALTLAVLKNIVATIPAAGSAGHLVQQAEMSLNALRAAHNPPAAPPEPDTSASESAGDKS